MRGQPYRAEIGDERQMLIVRNRKPTKQVARVSSGKRRKINSRFHSRRDGASLRHLKNSSNSRL
jgi:hypothetical protein